MLYLEIMRKNQKMKGRNNALIDKWSLVHLLTGILLGWLMNPVVALIIMTAWEPFEIFVLSPLLARFGINFGFESFKNSMSDIFVNAAGVVIGAYLLTFFVDPPFYFF